MKKRRVLSKITVWAAALCLLLSMTPLTASAVSAPEAGSASAAAISPLNIQPMAGNYEFPVGSVSGVKDIGIRDRSGYSFYLDRQSDVQFTFEHQLYPDNKTLCDVKLNKDGSYNADSYRTVATNTGKETVSHFQAFTSIPAWLSPQTITYYDLPAGGPYYFVVDTGAVWVLGATKAAWCSFSSRYMSEVTFIGNGAPDMEAKTVPYQGTYGELPVPSRPGYEFLGWYTAEVGGTQVTSSTPVTVRDDHYLYAQWGKRGPATGAQFSCSITDKTYTGGNQGISVTPHDGVGKATVYYTGINGTKYRKSTNKPKNIGTYRVTADAASGSFYEAAQNIVLGSFKIVPKSPSISKITAGKKQMSVKWKKISPTQKPVKYQMQYRAKGTSKWKTKSYSASVTSATIKGLKKGRAYEVQTRSLSKVNGKTYYSMWSKSKMSKSIR